MTLTPEESRKLASVVVLFAIIEARKPPYRIRCEVELERRDAIQWVLTPERSDQWIEAAGLDPQAVRSRVGPRLRVQ